MKALRISDQNLNFKELSTDHVDKENESTNIMRSPKSKNGSTRKQSTAKSSKYASKITANQNSEFTNQSASNELTKTTTDSKITNNPQMLDEDVNKFTIRLETMLSTFKSECVADFIVYKKQIINDQIAKIENEKKKCDNTVMQKHKELMAAKEQMEETKAHSTKIEAMNDAMSTQLMRAHHEKEAAKIRSSCFEKWLFKARMLQANNKVTDKMYNIKQSQLKRNAFVEWKKFYIDNKKNKTMDKINAQLKEQSEKLNLEYAHELQSLRDQLKDAKKQLENEAIAKQQIQENLKKAFMRGIYAMNYEASSIINVDQPEGIPVISPQVEQLKQEMPSCTLEITKENEPNIETRIDTKIESKDNKWQPAPVIGAEMPRSVVPQPLKPLNKIVPTTGIDGRSEMLIEKMKAMQTVSGNKQEEKPVSEEGKVIRINKKGMSYIEKHKY